MQFTYILALKGAQLNDPRGQQKNEGVTSGVKPFLPPQAKLTIFIMSRKKKKKESADVFSFKKKHALLIICIDHYHS